MDLNHETFIKDLKNYHFVEKIILFGSRAREDHQDRSDVDVALVLSPFSPENWLKIMDVIDEADTLLKIDCICYNTLPEKSPLKTAIDQEGVILFERVLMENKRELSAIKLSKALVSLKAMVIKPPQEDRSHIDACIQRFEFCVELFWKHLKRILESKGQEVTYPKDVLREAYRGGMIHEESLWLEMLRDRNQTSHTYNEDLANIIYKNIVQKYYPLMEKTYEKLQESEHVL